MLWKTLLEYTNMRERERGSLKWIEESEKKSKCRSWKNREEFDIKLKVDNYVTEDYTVISKLI